jgi:hypothetical protein
MHQSYGRMSAFGGKADAASRDETSLTVRMVISGDLKRFYTMDLTSTQGPIRGVAPPPVHVTTAYKYIGPCEADQRPGDFITGDGRKIHLFGDPKPHDQP